MLHAGIVRIAHAGQRPDLLHVDLPVGQDDLVRDVDADDLADDDVHGAALAVPGQDDGLHIFTFQVDGAVRHPAGLHQLAFGLGEARLFKFVHFRREGGGGDVHGLPEGVGHDVVDEFAGLLDVHGGVLPLARGAAVDGHQHIGRVEGQVGELAVRGQIVHPVGADGAQPADHPGDRAGFEGGSCQAVVVFRSFVEHILTSVISSRLPGPLPRAPWCRPCRSCPPRPPR